MAPPGAAHVSRGAKAGQLGGALDGHPGVMQEALCVRDAQPALVLTDGHAGVLAEEPGQVALAHVTGRGQLGPRPAPDRVARDLDLDAVHGRVFVFEGPAFGNFQRVTDAARANDED